MSDAKQTVIPKGALLTVSTGSYSDYYVRGVFRALDEIRTDELMAEWLKANPEQASGYSFDDHKFMGWVARKGLLEPLDSFEWHLDTQYGGPINTVDGPTICDVSN